MTPERIFSMFDRYVRASLCTRTLLGCDRRILPAGFEAPGLHEGWFVWCARSLKRPCWSVAGDPVEPGEPSQGFFQWLTFRVRVLFLWFAARGRGSRVLQQPGCGAGCVYRRPRRHHAVFSVQTIL